MTWLALRLFLGGAVQKLVQWLSHRSFWQLVCMGLACVIVVQHFTLAQSRAEAAKWHKQFDAEHSGRLSDRKTYQQAQDDAAGLNKAQVARVEQQQQKVTDDAEARYRADLARLRVQSANAAPKGSPGSPGAGKASPAPSGPDRQAVPLSGPELLRAQETELQLNALIDWVVAQSKVDPNKP